MILVEERLWHILKKEKMATVMVIMLGDETREIDGTIYPVLRNELMTGFLNSGDNYLTPITLGLLEDNGFGVDYTSEHVVSTG